MLFLITELYIVVLMLRVMFSPTTPKANLTMKTAKKLTTEAKNIYKHHLQVSSFIFSLSGFISENKHFEMRQPQVGKTHPLMQENTIPISTLMAGLL